MQNINETHNLTLDKNQYLILNNQRQVHPGIGLLGIFEVLYKKRRFIITSTFIFTLIAMLYSLTIVPVYQVKSSLAQPNQDQIQALYLNTNSSLTSAQLFAVFLKSLTKKSNYIEFLQVSGLLDEAMKEIKNPTAKDRLAVLKRLAKNYDVMIVNHFMNDPKDAFKDSSLEAELVTRSRKFDANGSENLAYIEFTNKKLLDSLSIGERSVAKARMIYLNKWINLRDKELLVQRKNEIKRLYDKQSLTIAEIKNKIIALNQKDERDRTTNLQELNNALKIAEKLGITDYNASVNVK
ncbi:MAG: Wzz/FepE/Etk N-terminal domain-containing protein, partial [Legionella sp.]